MLVKCPCCKGAKQLMGPGCIYKDCKECKGKGEVKREVPEDYHSDEALESLVEKQNNKAKEEVKKVVKVTPENKKNSRSKK